VFTKRNNRHSLSSKYIIFELQVFLGMSDILSNKVLSIWSFRTVSFQNILEVRVYILTFRAINLEVYKKRKFCYFVPNIYQRNSFRNNPQAYLSSYIITYQNLWLQSELFSELIGNSLNYFENSQTFWYFNVPGGCFVYFGFKIPVQKLNVNFCCNYTFCSRFELQVQFQYFNRRGIFKIRKKCSSDLLRIPKELFLNNQKFIKIEFI